LTVARDRERPDDIHLVLRPLASAYPVQQRLKRALKCLLRSFQFQCIRIAKQSAKSAIVSAEQQQVSLLSEQLDRRRDELLAAVAQKISPELQELASLRLRRGYLLDEVHAVRVLMESLLVPTPPVKRRWASELLEV
jgi:hypothetical protein